MTIWKRIEQKIQTRLSHYPKWYALIVGIGVVLFWRGVWHSVDNLHMAITHFYFDPSTSLPFETWWDGPLSFVVGALILSFTGAFTSSFIGNELILSGLRGERKLNQKTEASVEDEVTAISDIQEELATISSKMAALEKHVHSTHSNK